MTSTMFKSRFAQGVSDHTVFTAGANYGHANQPQDLNQSSFNRDLNRYLEGEPKLCDPFVEDCSAVYQAQKAADAREAGNEADAEVEEEDLETIDQTSFSVFTF